METMRSRHSEWRVSQNEISEKVMKVDAKRSLNSADSSIPRKISSEKSVFVSIEDERKRKRVGEREREKGRKRERARERVSEEFSGSAFVCLLALALAKAEN